MQFNILKNGDLEIRLDDDDDRDDVAACRGAQWFSLFDWIGNSKVGQGWGSVEPEWIGALTDAPIVTDEYDVTDDGHHRVLGTVWWFPNYCVEDPAETLLEKGRVVFTLAWTKDGMIRAPE